MLDQIESVAVGIRKHRYRAVNLVTRLFQKAHADCQHRGMVAGEIVGLQKEADTPAGLVADGRALRLACRLRQQKGGSIPPLGFTTTQRLPSGCSSSCRQSKPRPSQ